MKIIKNINNNFAIALDGANNQLIVSGKGIGFGPVPREIKDMTVIDRSYYDVDSIYITMINDIPEEIIDIATQIVDKARNDIDNPLSSNIVFTLADHIHFAIDRYKKKMNIKLPLLYDVKNLFEKEMAVGEYGLKLIRNQIHVFLPKDEAAYIALHIINAEEKSFTSSANDDDSIIDAITTIIEEEYEIEINKSNFNYSRFVSHVHYLLKRGREKELVKTKNKDIYFKLVTEYPKTYQCTEIISKYLANNYGLDLNEEEKLYLMLHINRLCTRENNDDE